MSHESFERFAQGMRLWAPTAGLQIPNHLQAKSVGITQYETIRGHTSGMNPCLALSDRANAGAVDLDECRVYIFQYPSGWLYLQFWIYIGGLKPHIDPRRLRNQLTCLLSPNIYLTWLWRPTYSLSGQPP
jgi:hypothetical protein